MVQLLAEINSWEGFVHKGAFSMRSWEVSLQEVKRKIPYFSRWKKKACRVWMTCRFCSCAFFQRKFCTSGSCGESFWRMMTVGKQLLLKSWRRCHCDKKLSGEGIFWKFVLDSKIEKEKLICLINCWAGGWTTLVNSCGFLRIRRLPDERSYVIRDVLAFADSSRKKDTLQLAGYYEPISCKFDEELMSG